MTRYTHGIATASWIDKGVVNAVPGRKLIGSLPVNDGTGPSPMLHRAFFQACRGFRFANFLEAGIEVEGGRIVAAGFTPDSRGYFSDSFLGHPSHAYTPRRTMVTEGDDRVFTQIVGARTTGQEEAGGAVGYGVAVLAAPMSGPLAGGIGRGIGQRAARQVQPFAPIWSELEIRFSPSGAATGRLRRFSLFPSLTYYVQQSQGAGTLVETLQQTALPYGPARYEAGQDSLQLWFRSGWGMVRGGTLGPAPGNPWGIENDGRDTERRAAA